MKPFREYLAEAKIKDFYIELEQITKQLNQFENHGGPEIKQIHNKILNLNKSKDFSVTIEDEPKLIAGKCFVSSREFAKIIEFIKLNKENLLKYWNYGLSTHELAHNMLKVSD